MTRRLLPRIRISPINVDKVANTGFAGAGCLFVCFWLLSALISLAISGGILAAIIAGCYYLATGEFIIR